MLPGQINPKSVAKATEREKKLRVARVLPLQKKHRNRKYETDGDEGLLHDDNAKAYILVHSIDHSPGQTRPGGFKQ